MDTIPPTVIRTDPDTNAVRVDTRSVTLEFSKYVNRRTLEESVFISPYVGDLEFEWSGREVTARWADSLRRNTTYVVTIGTDVADIRAGNRMASAFTLAFSTGDSIDRGYAAGRVYDDKPEGVMVFAYRLAGGRGDTLDPSHSKPDYITQTGKIGTFELSHLAFGTYRLIAVRDEYRDLLYEKQVDQYGVATGDVVLNDSVPRINGIAFRLAKEDTTRPFLAGVRARDRYRISVRFSEPIDSASIGRARAVVVDTLTGMEVPVRLLYQERTQPSLAGVLTAAPLDSPATYRVRVAGVADRSGNRIDFASPGELIAGILLPDTLRPRITVRDMRDSVRGVANDLPIEVLFSDPVAQPPLSNAAVGLFDSTRSVVEAPITWTGPASLALVPRAPLNSKAWYVVRVVMDSVRSLLGRGYRDSTFVLRFQTVDLRATGTFSGVVEDLEGARGKGRVFVTATKVDGAGRNVSITLNSPGLFSFDHLAEGKYVLIAYRDADNSGNFSFGLPFPFTPAERFVVSADTVRVRARWSVEGAVLKFR
ncbi:MAG: Ig-like domain-containing protein [Bacteroidota bacterium]